MFGLKSKGETILTKYNFNFNLFGIQIKIHLNLQKKKTLRRLSKCHMK